MKILLKNKSSEEIYKLLNLEEDSIYLVKVKAGKNNIEHVATLFTGFKTGSYNYIYTNAYKRPFKLQEYYQLEVIKQMHSSKEDNGTTIKCSCCGKNKAEVCANCVSDIAQETGE